jgi:hypothetical protein
MLGHCFRLLPKDLTAYWTSVAVDMWMRCSARVGVLMGEAARAAYEDALVKIMIASKIIELPGCPDIRATYARQSRPFAFVEFANGGVTRIVFATADPESFHCMRTNPDSKTARLKGKSQEIFPAARCHGLQERILEFANLLAFESMLIISTTVAQTT